MKTLHLTDKELEILRKLMLYAFCELGRNGEIESDEEAFVYHYVQALMGDEVELTSELKERLSLSKNP